MPFRAFPSPAHHVMSGWVDLVTLPSCVWVLPPPGSSRLMVGLDAGFQVLGSTHLISHLKEQYSTVAGVCQAPVLCYTGHPLPSPFSVELVTLPGWRQPQPRGRDSLTCILRNTQEDSTTLPVRLGNVTKLSRLVRCVDLRT